MPFPFQRMWRAALLIGLSNGPLVMVKLSEPLRGLARS